MRAAPVLGGIGMVLLERMGWKKGEGLGRNKEGGLEPIMLEVKMDRRGEMTRTRVDLDGHLANRLVVTARENERRDIARYITARNMRQ